MTKEQVTSLAAAVMSASASAVTFYITPLVERSDADSWLKILGLLAGTIGFYGIFRIVHYILNYYRHRRILGKWFYYTQPYELDFKDKRRFAKMRIFLDRNDELAYKVEVFGSWEKLLENDLAGVQGTACSDAIRYDPEKSKLSILYHVQYHHRDGEANPDRYGRLFLTLSSENVLTGHWVSDVDKTYLSSGTMFAARPRDFRQHMLRGDQGATMGLTESSEL